MQYGQLRAEFDGQCDLLGGASEVLALSRLLFIFYQHDSDHHRLVRSSPTLHLSAPSLISPPSPQVKLCQKWLHYRRDLAAEAGCNSICKFHLGRVLVRCCFSLGSLSPSQPLFPHLRMLEVFTDPSTYPSPHQHTITSHLSTYLIGNGKLQLLCFHGNCLMKALCLHNYIAAGYFSCLRNVLEQRVPSPETPGPTHSPLTSSLLDFFVRPLRCASEDKR